MTGVLTGREDQDPGREGRPREDTGGAGPSAHEERALGGTLPCPQLHPGRSPPGQCEGRGGTLSVCRVSPTRGVCRRGSELTRAQTFYARARELFARRRKRVHGYSRGGLRRGGRSMLGGFTRRRPQCLTLRYWPAGEGRAGGGRSGLLSHPPAWVHLPLAGTGCSLHRPQRPPRVSPGAAPGDRARSAGRVAGAWQCRRPGGTLEGRLLSVGPLGVVGLRLGGRLPGQDPRLCCRGAA